MQSDPEADPASEVLQALKESCVAGQSYLTLADFIKTVLYHPSVGYYTRQKKRVGRTRNADFYTAASIGKVFSRLVVASCRSMLSEPLKRYIFVEAGPETETGIIGELEQNPFRSTRLIRPGDSFEVPDKAIVFSNELFDAQPFRRLIFRNGLWREMGIEISDSSIQWVEVNLDVPPEGLPGEAPDGYIIDWPQHAFSLLESLCRQQWQGLLLAFDYGLDSHTIFRERPHGTGRTYSRHNMGSNLLERPGEVDITCHIIWDIMEDILRDHNFNEIRVQRQEGFFMNFAKSEIEHVMTTAALGFSPEKQSLMQLLHPGNMGHKFQVLSALRRIY